MLAQDSLSLRSVIAASAGLTILYTPVLKRMTAVKNLVVAAIIAASPLAGALAAGAVSDAFILSYTASWLHRMLVS